MRFVRNDKFPLSDPCVISSQKLPFNNLTTGGPRNVLDKYQAFTIVTSKDARNSAKPFKTDQEGEYSAFAKLRGFLLRGPRFGRI
jgi:hypothetical protein